MNGEVKDIAFSKDGQRMYSHGGRSLSSKYPVWFGWWHAKLQVCKNFTHRWPQTLMTLSEFTVEQPEMYIFTELKNAILIYYRN